MCLRRGLFIPLLPPFLPHSVHLSLPPGTPLTLYPVCFLLSTALACDVGRLGSPGHTHTHTHTHHGALDWWFPLLHAYAMALFIIIYHFTIPTPLAIHMGIIILWCGCRVYSTEDCCKNVHSVSELEFIPLNTFLKQLPTALLQGVLSGKYGYEMHKGVWYLWSCNISRWSLSFTHPDRPVYWMKRIQYIVATESLFEWYFNEKSNKQLGGYCLWKLKWLYLLVPIMLNADCSKVIHLNRIGRITKFVFGGKYFMTRSILVKFKTIDQ